MTTITNSNVVSDELYAAMNPGKTGVKSASEQAQDRFMTLLITQMQHQDPLNPMDNAATTSQLAQLSTVSGIEKLNDAMTAMMERLQSGHNLQATTMIGRSVLVPGDAVQLVDGKGFFAVNLPNGADLAKVEILDADGKVVRTFNVDGAEPGLMQMGWDGKTDTGATAPNGSYTFHVSATLGGEKAPAERLGYGAVTSVETGAGGVYLNVPGFGKVSLADVREVV